MGIGVLLEGRSGLGKSDTALALVRRGHSLVADDITAVRRDTAGSAERIAALIRENEELRKNSKTRARVKMPDTRMSLTHKFEIAGHEGGAIDNREAVGSTGDDCRFVS